MKTHSFESWLAGAADDVPTAEFHRIVRLQVAVISRADRSPLRQRDGEVTVKWFARAAALRDVSRPDDGRTNRVVGFRPAAIDLVDEWVRYYEGAGIACQIDVVPSCFTEPVRASLTDRGFEFRGAACTSIADPRALAPREHPDVTVEDVTSETLAEALEIAASGRDRAPLTPERVRLLQLDLARSPQLLVSPARIDGEPAAVASVSFDGKAAYLANAVTAPAMRRRGCQAALIDHRVRAATRRGCDLMVTDTLVGVESQRNVERAGLRRAFSVGWFCKPRA